jgi:chromosome condensin MukBEF ATPase and DNA-binding subunit MukB
MYNGEMDACTTRILNKLKQSYQITATKKVAAKRGWCVSEQVLENGKVALKLRVR